REKPRQAGSCARSFVLPARHEVFGSDGFQGRNLTLAMRRLDRAAWSEGTTRRESQRVRHAAGDNVEPVLLFPQAWDRRQQSLRIGMLGIGEQLRRRRLLDDAARIHDLQTVAHLREYPQVKGD